MTDPKVIAQKWDNLNRPKKDRGWIPPIVALLITILIGAAFYFFYLLPMQDKTTQQSPKPPPVKFIKPENMMFKLHDTAIKEGDNIFYNGSVTALNILWQPDQALVIGKENLLGAWRLASKYQQPQNLANLYLTFDQPIDDYLSDLTLYFVDSHGLRNLEKIMLDKKSVISHNPNLAWQVYITFPETFVITPNVSDIVVGISGTPKTSPKTTTINVIASAQLIPREHLSLPGTPVLSAVVSNPLHCPFTLEAQK